MTIQSIDFKAGDTFSFYFEIYPLYLDALETYAARARLIDVDSQDSPPPVIATLTCTVTAPVVSGDNYVVLLEKDASDTEGWPRPANPRSKRRLMIDCELYTDADPEIVHSTTNAFILIPYDPTRPA